jgi:hypothetical protein
VWNVIPTGGERERLVWCKRREATSRDAMKNYELEVVAETYTPKRFFFRAGTIVQDPT